MNAGRELQFSLASHDVKGPCRKLLHFTAITLTRLQPRGVFRRVKYVAHHLSRSENVVKILTKKEGRSNVYVGNRLGQFFCSI